MAPHAPCAESRTFYGWWVVVAFSLILFLSTGIRFAVGPSLEPVTGNLGIDRGTFSLAISLLPFLFVHQTGAALGSSRAGFPTGRPMRRQLQPVAGGR